MAYIIIGVKFDIMVEYR